MQNKGIKSRVIIVAISSLLASSAFAFDMGNMMNPSKWMGGDDDDHDDYYGGPGYGYGGYPGYGPGYGYGGYPGYGPGYGYGGYPGYGYGGYPGYGAPGYGYGAPGYGYGAQGGEAAPAPTPQ